MNIESCVSAIYIIIMQTYPSPSKKPNKLTVKGGHICKLVNFWDKNLETPKSNQIYCFCTPPTILTKKLWTLSLLSPPIIFLFKPLLKAKQIDCQRRPYLRISTFLDKGIEISNPRYCLHTLPTILNDKLWTSCVYAISIIIMQTHLSPSKMQNKLTAKGGHICK